MRYKLDCAYDYYATVNVKVCSASTIILNLMTYSQDNNSADKQSSAAYHAGAHCCYCHKEMYSSQAFKIKYELILS